MTRRLLTAAFVVVVALGACRERPPSTSYLFVWAGADGENASDFLGVIDADPSSSKYGTIVASVPTGATGTHPHHTEGEMPPNSHLLANGFHAGRTWLFDLSRPLKPTIMTSFGDVDGFSHPHTYVRQPDGQVLATFQYAATGDSAGHDSAHAEAKRATGGLVEMDENGRVVRSASARDTTIPDSQIFPYSVLPVPALDRAVMTTTDMDEKNAAATSEWVQVWRLSDLALLRTVALKPGPRGDEHHFTGEPRLLPDGKSVYIHTFNCGLYLLRNLDQPEPQATFVRGFEGKECGVPLLVGHYWLQPVPAQHSLVSLDISDAEHPREVSTVAMGDDEWPHWLALDPTGRRLVVNSAGHEKSGNRLFVIDFDPATGQLTMDDRFRDAGATRPGVSLTGKTWPHGFSGRATPHGAVFSR